MPTVQGPNRVTHRAQHRAAALTLRQHMIVSYAALPTPGQYREVRRLVAADRRAEQAWSRARTTRA
jgi:hypothetical protein